MLIWRNRQNSQYHPCCCHHNQVGSAVAARSRVRKGSTRFLRALGHSNYHGRGPYYSDLCGDCCMQAQGSAWWGLLYLWPIKGMTFDRQIMCLHLSLNTINRSQLNKETTLVASLYNCPELEFNSWQFTFQYS